MPSGIDTISLVVRMLHDIIEKHAETSLSESLMSTSRGSSGGSSHAPSSSVRPRSGVRVAMSVV